VGSALHFAQDQSLDAPRHPDRDGGPDVWASYQQRLDAAEAAEPLKIVRPDGCDRIDISKGLFSDIPYVKGAFFSWALEQRVGSRGSDQESRGAGDDGVPLTAHQAWWILRATIPTRAKRNTRRPGDALCMHRNKGDNQQV
jgi:hypothetical protein